MAVACGVKPARKTKKSPDQESLFERKRVAEKGWAGACVHAKWALVSQPTVDSESVTKQITGENP